MHARLYHELMDRSSLVFFFWLWACVSVSYCIGMFVYLISCAHVTRSSFIRPSVVTCNFLQRLSM